MCYSKEDMIQSKQALIDVSADNANSLGVKLEGLLLCGVQFPAAMTGSSITFDFSLDNSTWVDVKKQMVQMLVTQFQQEMW